MMIQIVLVLRAAGGGVLCTFVGKDLHGVTEQGGQGMLCIIKMIRRIGDDHECFGVAAMRIGKELREKDKSNED